MRCNYCQKTIVRNLKVKEILFPWTLPISELCDDCRKSFVPLKKAGSCPGCMRQAASFCLDCQAWQRQYPDYEFAHEALFAYEDGFAQWLAMYKFTGDYRLRWTFAQEVRQALKKYPGFILCPIPLAKGRWQERGFNQTTGFLQAAGSSYQELLHRAKQDLPQSKKTREERLRLAQPYFLAVSPEKIYGKKILLVDDVYTTGRTLFHAAQILLTAHPAQICTFSLAR